MKYAWIARPKTRWPVTLACEVLEVSASGYFEHWRRKGADKPSRPWAGKRITGEALLVHIKAIHAEVKGEYGWPRMCKELLARGIRVGKERVRRLMQSHGIKAILASFAGVLMLLRPAIDQNQTFAGLAGLLSGLGAAFAYMQVMAIARIGEPETRAVFYFAVGTAVAGGLDMAVTGLSPWNWKHAIWLLPLGLLASLGQMCTTKAYSMSTNHGGNLMVAHLQYSGIVFSAFYGVALFPRQHSVAGLGRHGAAHRQRDCRHGAAGARGAECAG